MTGELMAALSVRSSALKDKIRRYNLVFVHCGSGFNSFHHQLMTDVPHLRLDISRVIGLDLAELSETTVLVVSGVEELAETGACETGTLGQLRAKVDEILDFGCSVALLSRRPRAAFAPVPGSSLVDDSTPYFLPPLGNEELPAQLQGALPENCFPDISLVACEDSNEILLRIMCELGTGVLTALDHAIYECHFFNDFLEHVSPREVEALMSSGLAVRESGLVRLTMERREGEFRELLANALARSVNASPELGEVTSGIWYIERTIRRSVREHAIKNYGGKWRKNVLHGDLSAKALERAQAEANPTARSVSELRDPIEWLTLGELLEVARSEKFGGLSFGDVAWRRFFTEVLPIRNRLSHMRHLRRSDKDVVAMWVNQVKRAFD